MPITTATSTNGVTITISGRFDFQSNAAFRIAYETHPAGTTFVVDLQRVEYLDSSALGMLLLLRKHAGNTQDNVKIVNASRDVMRVLQIARFEQMFRVSAAA